MNMGLRILPVGGLGRIGMNAMLVGAGDRWVMVDCGVQWPDSDVIGADRQLPDLGFLESWKGKIEAIVLTHGHEDHIGALPWVWPILGDIPVYASEFTTELVKHRVGEHGLGSRFELLPMNVGDRIEAGPFEVEPIRVTHSLPDCASLFMRSSAGNLLHTGDWKIDEVPADGEHFDREAFARVGDEGVNVLLSDSTNARGQGRTRGEAQVAASLEEVISGHPGRVVVTQFASNLHRLHGLVEVAEKTGRRIAFAGRSLWRYLEAAKATGRAPIDPGRVVDMTKIGSLADEEALIVTTGSQGEALAALGQASVGRHPYLKIGPGDQVIHSARVIPGNEGSTYRMFNALSERGASLVYGGQTGVHASGHAKRDELAEMMDLTRPDHFVPVHGERTFLAAHAELARERGLKSVTVAVNGEELHFGPHSVVRAADHPLTEIFNDGPAIGDADAMLLKERKRIAWNGVVVFDAVVTRVPTLTLSDVRIRTRGIWTDQDTLSDLLESCAHLCAVNLGRAVPLGEIEERLEAKLRSLCRRHCGKAPDVLITLHTGRAS
jgi:beta-CASP RNase J family ribonuclease